MPETITLILKGAVLGLTAGISPGPLLTLVITETLKHNKKAGVKIAVAPLLTDIPIIAITILILSRLANFDIILGIISMLGGVFIIYLGYECLKIKSMVVDAQHLKPQSIKKGILVNILNPHPYLFWLIVGAPILFNAYQVNPLYVLCFIIPFYVFLVGSKIVVAFLVDKSKAFLQNKAFIWTIRLLGIILFVFAVLFIKEGLEFLKIY